MHRTYAKRAATNFSVTRVCLAPNNDSALWAGHTSANSAVSTRTPPADSSSHLAKASKRNARAHNTVLKAAHSHAGMLRGRGVARALGQASSIERASSDTRDAASNALYGTYSCPRRRFSSVSHFNIQSTGSAGRSVTRSAVIFWRSSCTLMLHAYSCIFS